MKLDKDFLKKATRYLTDPDYRFLVNAYRSKYDDMDDEAYLRRLYRAHMGETPDLEHPRTFNEKLQWLKLHDHNPLYTVMADKYRMRQYVAQKLGPGYTVPLLGVWEDPDDIDFEKLPHRFVLKCNHNSGLGMCICRDKSRLDIPRVREELRRGLAQDYYLTGREWPYRDIPRRILAEEFLTDSRQHNGLDDYKFYCFNGLPKIMYISQECIPGAPQDYFDMDFHKLDLTEEDPYSDAEIEKPACFDRMKQLAATLSAGVPFLRVDFYFIDNRIYVGELTFFHNSGFHKMEPRSWEETLGDWITLPRQTP